MNKSKSSIFQPATIKKLFGILLAIAAIALWLSGCGDSPTSAPGGVTNPPHGESSTGFGLVEITITDIGTPEMSASARPASKNVAANLTRPDDSDGKDGTIQLEAVSHGSFTYGTRGSGGVRYLYATFRVRNAQIDGTPYSSPRTNLTFLAVDTDGTGTAPATYGETPLSELRLYNGDELSATEAEDFANAMVPTGLAKLAADGSIGVQYADVMQVYTEDEITGLTNIPTGVSLFPYGFVTRNSDNPESRTLSASPPTGQYDGFVTFAFKIPLQAQANQDPFEITALFLPFDDSETRLTQSLEGQTADGKRQTLVRAGGLDAEYVTIFPGSGYRGAFRLLCGPVRVTGTAINPLTVLFPPAPTFSSLSPDPYANDGSAGNILKTQAFSADFNGPVTEAATNIFIVRGSQSGLQNLTYSGNGSNTINTSNAAFFPGEQVAVSLTPGLGICPSAGPFRYRVGVTGGSGTFSWTDTVSVGRTPYSVTAGDWDGDNDLDMAVGHRSDGMVSLLENNGSGDFTVTTVSVGNGMRWVTAGDWDGDGDLDLAVANYVDKNVSLLKNNGNGIFTTTTVIAVDNRPESITIGDWDGDGDLDLAVANSAGTTVSLLNNNGIGDFTEIPVSVGVFPEAVSAGDWNGDGNLDMAVVNRIDDNVSLLENNGSGGFIETTVAVGGNPQSITAGDWDRDGDADLAIGNYSDDTLSLLENGGAGGFTETTVAVGSTPRSIRTGDWNGDGDLDLTVANRSDNTVSLLENDGSGGFTETTEGVGTYPRSIAVGDWDGDGDLDLAVVNLADATVSLLTNQ